MGKGAELASSARCQAGSLGATLRVDRGLTLSCRSTFSAMRRCRLRFIPKIVSFRNLRRLRQCNAEENYSWKGPEKEWSHPGKQRCYPQELRLTIKVSFYNRFEIKRSTPLPPNHEYDVPSNFGFLSVLVFPKGDQ
jgi:hypothetical protein